MFAELHLNQKGSGWDYKCLMGGTVGIPPSAMQPLRLTVSLVVVPAPIHVDLSPQLLGEGPGKSFLTL